MGHIKSGSTTSSSPRKGPTPAATTDAEAAKPLASRSRASQDGPQPKPQAGAATGSAASTVYANGVVKLAPRGHSLGLSSIFSKTSRRANNIGSLLQDYNDHPCESTATALIVAYRGAETEMNANLHDSGSWDQGQLRQGRRLTSKLNQLVDKGDMEAKIQRIEMIRDVGRLETLSKQHAAAAGSEKDSLGTQLIAAYAQLNRKHPSYVTTNARTLRPLVNPARAAVDEQLRLAGDLGQKIEDLQWQRELNWLDQTVETLAERLAAFDARSDPVQAAEVLSTLADLQARVPAEKEIAPGFKGSNPLRAEMELRLAESQHGDLWARAAEVHDLAVRFGTISPWDASHKTAPEAAFAIDLTRRLRAAKAEAGD